MVDPIKTISGHKMSIAKKIFQLLGLRGDSRFPGRTGPAVETGSPVGLNWHEDFIVHLASIVRPRVYVELGLYQCELFNRVIPYSENLVGVDIDPMAGSFMHVDTKARFVNITTREFAENLRTNPIQIDMLFIDADHSDKAVEEDFESFLPFISPHGLVLLHDGHPSDEEQAQPGYCGTGYMAIDKLSRQTDEYEMMTIPVPPGLTLCRKRKFQLSWKEGAQGL